MLIKNVNNRTADAFTVTGGQNWWWIEEEHHLVHPSCLEGISIWDARLLPPFNPNCTGWGQDDLANFYIKLLKIHIPAEMSCKYFLLYTKYDVLMYILTIRSHHPLPSAWFYWVFFRPPVGERTPDVQCSLAWCRIPISFWSQAIQNGGGGPVFSWLHSLALPKWPGGFAPFWGNSRAYPGLLGLKG
jgi:hypothetical protein